jgi:hypothetical protein
LGSGQKGRSGVIVVMNSCVLESKQVGRVSCIGELAEFRRAL